MNNILIKIRDFVCHRNTRKAVYFLCIIGLISCVILLFSLLKTGDGDIKKKLDSLELRSKQLELVQLKYDSMISDQNRFILDMDYKISNIKEKTVIIKEYYKMQVAKVDSFSHNQIDSFFRNKYQY